MTLLIAIIAFIFILSFLFITHELGHFLVAKRVGIPVVEFGLGFPPRLLKWKKGETLYTINLIPFGAFVKILGDDNPQDPNPKSFWKQSLGKRFLTAGGGIASNLFWAWFILTIALWIAAILPARNFVLIQEVNKNSPAFSAGIKSGDLLIRGNGQVFKKSEEVTQFTKSHRGEEVEIVIRRFGKEVKKRIRLSNDSEAPLGIVMVDVSSGEKIAFWKAPMRAIITLGEQIYITAAYLGKALVSIFVGPKVPFEVGGPVAVWGWVYQFSAMGFLYLFWLAASLSLALGFFNLLPLPALDGGRLAFLALEKIFGKKIVKPETENAIHGVGFIVLIGLSILIAYKDVLRLIGR